MQTCKRDVLLSRFQTPKSYEFGGVRESRDGVHLPIDYRAYLLCNPFVTLSLLKRFFGRGKGVCAPGAPKKKWGSFYLHQVVL